MLSGIQFQSIANDIKTSRRKRNLKPEVLAGKVGVAARFVRNVEDEKSLQWNRQLLIQLLKVLTFLKLEQQVYVVEAVIQNSAVVRHKRRLKVDRRLGGAVQSRRKMTRR